MHPEKGFEVVFLTERDSATFQDKETEVPSLFWDKGTSSKSCQGTGWAETACQNPEQDAAGRDRTNF